MAQKVNIVLTDDLDQTGNTPADETVTFGLDGQTYEIDLSTANADKFRGFIYDYTAVARKVGKKTGTAGKRSKESNTAEIRAWARSNGHEVPERGRIPKAVVDAFNAR